MNVPLRPHSINWEENWVKIILVSLEVISMRKIIVNKYPRLKRVYIRGQDQKFSFWQRDGRSVSKIFVL